MNILNLVKVKVAESCLTIGDLMDYTAHGIRQARMLETQVWTLGQEDSLEKEMATHSSTLAGRIPWREEPPGRLQSMGSQRVGHDWATEMNWTELLHTCS